MDVTKYKQLELPLFSSEEEERLSQELLITQMELMRWMQKYNDLKAHLARLESGWKAKLDVLERDRAYLTDLCRNR